MLAFLGAGLLWRLSRYALCFPFWGDEAYLNISVLRRGFGDLLLPPEYTQVAPLLFLWVQRGAYLLLGGGEYALRAVPLLAGCGALLLLWRIARRELAPHAACFAVGIFAASYYLVRHTCESKPYAVDLFVATLLLWLGTQWWREPGRVRWPLGAAIVGSIAVWLSYPAVFVAAGLALALFSTAMRQRSWRAALAWSTYSAAVAASFLVSCAAFTAERAGRLTNSWLGDYWRDSFPPECGADFLGWLVRTHTGRMFAYPIGGSHFGSVITTLLCVLGMLGLWRARRVGLVGLLAAPVIPALIAAAMHRYPYGGSVRVSIHFAPAICLLAGAGVGVLVERVAAARARATLRGLLGVALIALALGGTIRDALQPYKSPEDAAMRRVMAEIAAAIQPGDAVGILNPVQGTYGPPDGPVFHQTLRYYFELYTGIRPRWMTDGTLGPDIRWLLVYRGPDFGPPRERVDEVAAAAGICVASARESALSGRTPQAVTLFGCAPAR